jgi:soluble lytic murein transglycosylase-like protein
MGKSALIVAAAVALVGAAIYYTWPGAKAGEGGALTAGDDESNALLDAVDTMTSKITGWPAGSAPYQETVQAAADTYGVPVLVVAWLLWKESRYNPAIIDGSKRSPVGALGIAQFMPATSAQELGSVEAALDPDIAIPGAARYLAKLYASTGAWSKALAAYNWGIGNVQRKGLASAPPETLDYFTTILSRAGMETTA